MSTAISQSNTSPSNTGQSDGSWASGGGRSSVSGAGVLPIVQVVGFAVLLAVAAQVKFFPAGSAVPVTLQTVAVLLCGYFLPPARAMAAVVLYLIAGLLGAPVFAALELGVMVITLGYLIGFIAAAGMVSFVVRSVRPKGFGGLAAVGSVGTLLIFLFGVSWIAVLQGDLGLAIGVGLLPYLPGAVVKIAVAACVARMAPLGWLRS